MTKIGLRAFAAGILFTSAVVALFYFVVFDPDTANHAKSDSQLEMDQVQSFLGAHDLKAVPVDEEQPQTTGTSGNQPGENAGQTKDNQAQEVDKKPEVKKITLHIKEGMTLPEVSDQLEADHLIKDSSDFRHYLESHDLAKYMQIGDFELNSDMSQEDIAHAITK